ncbi:hypothetical protein LOTGIDRAFT_152408 [Lottia gigantea]|uniref:Uncharacterized protein n=1 Tax=Lottia gigantea TaxID=225164 RepID=V4B4X6_LOTGI|nr:hypothetical protein LOTGIDRAFT_152408 [Lottia gigantea]ESP05553.1 hypothetical protein LOTGIDRAFT_152408 [Lottia gigantea]
MGGKISRPSCCYLSNCCTSVVGEFGDEPYSPTDQVISRIITEQGSGTKPEDSGTDELAKEVQPSNVAESDNVEESCNRQISEVGSTQSLALDELDTDIHGVPESDNVEQPESNEHFTTFDSDEYHNVPEFDNANAEPPINMPESIQDISTIENVEPSNTSSCSDLVDVVDTGSLGSLFSEEESFLNHLPRRDSQPRPRAAKGARTAHKISSEFVANIREEETETGSISSRNPSVISSAVEILSSRAPSTTGEHRHESRQGRRRARPRAARGQRTAHRLSEEFLLAPEREETPVAVEPVSVAVHVEEPQVEQITRTKVKKISIKQDVFEGAFGTFGEERIWVASKKSNTPSMKKSPKTSVVFPSASSSQLGAHGLPPRRRSPPRPEYCFAFEETLPSESMFLMPGEDLRDHEFNPGRPPNIPVPPSHSSGASALLPAVDFVLPGCVPDPPPPPKTRLSVTVITKEAEHDLEQNFARSKMYQPADKTAKKNMVVNIKKMTRTEKDPDLARRIQVLPQMEEKHKQLMGNAGNFTFSIG